MEPVIVALKTVLPLFLVIFAGTIFSKTKRSSELWVDILNKYALWIGFPALIIASLMQLETGEKSYVNLILLNSAYIVGSILLAFPLARLFNFSSRMKRTLFLILPFGNVAYLGIPVLNNAFGSGILPVAAIISAVYVFWLLTLSLILVEVYGQSTINLKKLVMRLIQNPLLIAVFLGLTIVSFDLEIPLVVQKTIHLFSDSVTAVVLFSLGIFLGMQHVGSLHNWTRVALWSLVTMALLPALFYILLSLSSLQPLQLKATILDAAMPLGLTPYALSIQYKLETTLVARMVVLGTLLSLVLIPIWIVFLG